MDAPRPPTDRLRPLAIGALAVAVGLVAWSVCGAASYHADANPRFAYFFPALAASAALLAIASRLSPAHIAVALVAPALVLAPFTAPRGDEDGLWVLIFPFLLVGGAFLAAGVVLTRTVVAWLRTRG